jgi:Protein of unknown function (DUF3500)
MKMKKQLFSFILILNYFTIFGQTNFDQTASLKAANAFLETLNPAQKSIANLPLSDTSRRKWDNVPFGSVRRFGIQIKDLSDTQRIGIHSLLRTVLSPQGYQKMMFIIQGDQAIHDKLAKTDSIKANNYGNKNYFLTIFGEPNKDKTWAWKFEGHHVSFNFTYSPKGVTCTPMFIGINPALTTTGMYAGNHILFEENDFGTQLFNSLNPELKKKAIISEHPQDADVMTRIGKEAHLKDKKGVKYNELNIKQQALIENIIRTWIENLTPALAQEKVSHVLANKNAILFTWQGTLNTNELHYYSIKTDDFIIEFSNRDQGIYHYHTLWRDLTEDFLSK